MTGGIELGLYAMLKDADQLLVPDPYYSGSAGFVGSKIQQLHADMQILELPDFVPLSLRRFHDSIRYATSIRISPMIS
jgi:hypothetical protein